MEHNSLDQRMQLELDELCAALEQSPNQRHQYLTERHAGDPAMRDRLLHLVAAHERAEAATPDEPQSSNDERPALPSQIDRYRVLERLGEGGMGSVYAAEQSEPFQRRVAIKIIKLGMDTREVIARFEAERQALALMDHPGVAKALDAGSTAEGRPYFVMELVPGQPLVSFCDTHDLPLRARLELFVRICSAIQHAHQKGIIHRDLKPSNILVSRQDGVPAPKVIDFGIAKATASPLTERTLLTERGHLLGTPEYMAPEQADSTPLNVDTRADVYSLGVILYQLITDDLPFAPDKLRAGGYDGIVRTIREVQPPRPSARLLKRAATTGSDASANAAESATDSTATTRLARMVRGELDWVVMRAIEKDRDRRYPTASALAEDVERYLARLPVRARPPSLSYAVRKFIDRHRVATALLALVAISVVLGVTGLATGLLRARAAEALALDRAERAQATARFLERVLFRADPEHGGGSPTLLDVLGSAEQLIRDDLARHPEVEAAVRESLGVAYRRRSLFEKAEPNLKRSLELRRAILGADHPDTARSLIAVAGLRFESYGAIAEARELLAQAIANYSAHGYEDTALEAWLQLDIGFVELAADRLAIAERAFARCRELLTRELGSGHPNLSRPLRGLAEISHRRGDLRSAEQLARQAVLLGATDDSQYIEARARLVLAELLLATDQLDEAAEQLTQAGREFVRMLGETHIRTGEHAATLARLHLQRGDHAAASRAAARCERVREQLMRPGHHALIEARLLRLQAEPSPARQAQAAAELQQLAATAAERLAPDHPLTIAIERARLDAARTMGDKSAISRCEDRVAELQSQRDRRLRANRK